MQLIIMKAPVKVVTSHFSGLEATFRRVAREAVLLAQSYKCVVRFHFNGVTVEVEARSKLRPIEREYGRAYMGFRSKMVGPYQRRRLSRAQRKRDVRLGKVHSALCALSGA